MVKKTELIKEVPEEQRKSDIKAIMEGHYPEQEEAILGENRGQLFCRIPQFITRRLKLKKGNKLLFRVYSDKDNHQRLEVEIVNE